MSREITVVVRGQTGSVSSLPLKNGAAVTAESHNNYRLLVDGKEKLPEGTKFHRSGRDLKIRFADGEEVTIADWAGADGARFETGGAQVYSDALRCFVPAQQVESWQFEILGTGDVVAGQVGVAPEALLASSALAATAAPSVPVAATPVTASAAGAGAGAGASASASAGAATSASAASSTAVATKAAAAAGGGFSGTGVLLGLGALGGLAAAAGGGGGGSSSGGGSGTSSSPAPSAPTGLALVATSDSGTAGDNVTSDTTPTVSGRGDPGSSIEVRNASGTTIATATVDSAGNWTATPASVLADGSQTLQVVANRGTGTNASAATPITLTIDSTASAAPVVRLDATSDSGVAGDGRTNDATPTLSGTGNVGDTIRVTLPGGTVLTTVVAANGTWSVTPTVALPNGVAAVAVTATDVAGNVSTAATTSVTVDTAVAAPGAPDLAAASDTGASSIDNLTRTATPTFSGAGVEAGATITLYDTNNTTVLGSALADGAGAWSIVSTALSAGTHTLTARQVDAAGNASTASAGLVVTIDTAAPAFGKALTVNEGFSTLSIDSGALAGTDNLTSQANLAVSAATFKSSSSFGPDDLGIAIVSGKATVSPVAGAINRNGTVVLSVTMQDAAGNTTTQDVTVTVNSVNDAPSGVDRTVTATEDGVYTLSGSDFAFTDAADSPANALKSVIISSLPGAGSLSYNGKAATSGLEITAADIAAGKLTFAPVTDAVGAGYASFTFRVRDDGGTLNGGVDLDGSANKLTIDVVDGNDAPVLDASKSPAISTAEYAFSGGTDAAVHAPVGANPTGFFTASSLVTGAVADVDAGAKLGVGITRLSATAVDAALWYSTDAGATWDWISNTAGSKVTKGFHGADGVVGGTDNNVLLLADTARLVFDGGKSGQQASIADALTLRAWDQSSGTSGGTLTNPVTGGSSPLSTATDTVQASFTTQAIDLTRLDAAAGVRITGATAGAQFGWDVTSAGDANGDGFDDVLVSQRGTAGSGGSAFLVYGQTGSYGAVGADGTRSVGIGAATGARFDRPGEYMTGVTQLGDFNNDGYGDFMISGVRTNDDQTGTSYVVFGGAAIADIGALGVPNANGKWFQIQAGGTSGIGINNHAASWTGDVNGDGHDDLIIGAKYTPQSSSAPFGFGSGAAYVVYGHAGTKFGTNNNLSLAALRTDVTKLADDGNPAGYLFDAGTDTRGIVLGVGASSGYFFGRGVAGVGDRNGDGYADYAVDVDLGADAVNALVMHGKLTTDVSGGGGGNVLWFAAASGYAGPDWIGHGNGPTPNVGVNPYRIRVGGNNDYTGAQNEPDRINTQALGDVNGDGFDDWAMSYNGIGAGKVYVIYGSTTVLDDGSSAAMASGTAGFSITGAALGDRLGESIHGIGDVNGDGYDDIVVGAPRNEAGTATDQGGAYIVYGRADAGADDINLASGIGTRGVAIRGSVTGDQAGFAVNSAGDVNGDGLDDLMIGAPENDAAGANSGAAYLVYGSTTYGNGTATTGTTLTGTAGANSLVGTAGADTLNGGAGGADAISAGAGNDTITVGSNGWLRVDGGAGLDTLKVGAAMTLDFTEVGTAAGKNLSGHTRSIERVDLGVGSFASKMTIAEQDVYQLAGDFTATGGSLSGRKSNTLFVVGDASDTFTFSEGVGGASGWTVAATAVNALGDGSTYTQFTRGTASVYVASGVTVAGVTSGTSAANLITGTGTNELIAGLAGADIITGGAGNDTLYGGAIGSTATADGIKDIFAYSLTPNTAHGSDVIKDFQVGTDRLYLIDTADSYVGTPGGPSSSVAVSALAPNGSTAAYAAGGTPYQGFNAAAAVTATTNDDIDNNLSIRDLTLADSANQYVTFGTDGLGNVQLTVVAGTATSTITLEGVQYEASAIAANGKYGSLAELMGGGSETRVLYLTNDPFGNGLATLP